MLAIIIKNKWEITLFWEDIELIDEIAVKNDLLNNISSLYKRVYDSINEIEKTLKNGNSSLDWNISEKQNIENKLNIIIRRMEKLKELSLDIAKYVDSTLNSLQNVDNNSSNKLETDITYINNSNLNLYDNDSGRSDGSPETSDGNVCNNEACFKDAGAFTACGGAACAAAACFAAACGGDACVADACGGDACGAAASIVGGCAAAV